MKRIYSGKSLKIDCTCYDNDGVLVIPETLTYTIQKNDGTLIRTETVEPTSSTYTVKVTTIDNIIEALEEFRKVVINWTYNGGEDGDTIIYSYIINQS